MNFYMDMHTHTMASGHGYSTLKENIEEAEKKGLKVLGLSEHGPAMPGGPHIFFLHNYRAIPRQYGELQLFCGAEANLIDLNGRLDLEDKDLKRLDYVIASMHTVCVTPGSRKENTKALMQAMYHPYVNIIGHPDDDRFPVDYAMLVAAAKETGKILEVNNTSLHPKSSRKGGRENVLALLKECRKQGVEVLLGTDSHICYTIGDFKDTMPLLAETEFPEELILNCDMRKVSTIVNVPVDESGTLL